MDFIVGEEYWNTYITRCLFDYCGSRSQYGIYLMAGGSVAAVCVVDVSKIGLYVVLLAQM